jgi:hypothetical protein
MRDVVPDVAERIRGIVKELPRDAGLSRSSSGRGFRIQLCCILLIHQIQRVRSCDGV